MDLTVLLKLGLQEGIDAVKSALCRCWFDERRCEKGIRALENYRKEWNDSLGTWRDRPRHDHFSNGSDAFRYLVMALEDSKESMTKFDLDKLKANAYARTGQSFANKAPPTPTYSRGF